MLSLIDLYFWTILAGVLAAPVLAVLGAQLATRERAIQTLCVGQGALVGVLLGLGVLHAWEETIVGAIGPFLFAIIFSASTFLATDKLVEKRMASKNTIFIFIFALLLALGNLISAVFPALESHMAQIYFGDLATLSVLNSKIVFGASLVSMLILNFNSKAISNQSFESAIYGTAGGSKKSETGLVLFKLLTICILCFSVQFVGFLYTIGMLFLPTALLSYTQTKGLRFHLTSCAMLSSVSAFIGFMLSLKYTRLPTVPAIVVSMFVLGLSLIVVEKFYLKVRKSKQMSMFEPVKQLTTDVTQ